MDDRRVCEYFVVAGLPDNPKPLADFSCDGATFKASHNQPPITDLAVINRSLAEVVPDGECLNVLECHHHHHHHHHHQPSTFLTLIKYEIDIKMNLSCIKTLT